MSRNARQPVEVESVRQSILDAALEIIIEEGFGNASMRKIGRRIGMTAPNLYNYFSGKDEINLEILRCGFEEFYQRLVDNYNRADTPFKGLVSIVDTYVDFSLEKPNYFDLMWNRPTPKYYDYVGTDFEEMASREKQSALKVFNFFIQAVIGAAPQGRNIDAEEARNIVMEVWTHAHGTVALYVNRLLIEVDDNPQHVVERTVVYLKNRLYQILYNGNAPHNESIISA
ncbi:MAG TPA: TetR/AcrR family transcriptional regulator [Spirochaetota bacterium]|nr:TetR/AcrR family transcriptional regulator [Spirochaetota bacterium]HQP50386.1 TetR/AcrR family transcriptional regulator [Spirochaetota bacterium]